MLLSDIIYSTRLSDFLTRVRGISPDCSYVVYCREGRFRVLVGQSELEVCAGQMLMVVPGTAVLLREMSDDCECHMMAVFAETRRELSHFCTQQDANWWSKSVFIRRNPVLQLTYHQGELCRVFSEFYTVFTSKTGETSDTKIVRWMLHAGMLALLDWVGEQMEDSYAVELQGRKEVIFKQFVILLRANKGYKREVIWYARQLAISPKYLTTICRLVCGKSASTLMDDATMQEIKHLLLDTSLSTQEICRQLGFSSTSFFCKYLKRELGMSAKEYRQQNKKRFS